MKRVLLDNLKPGMLLGRSMVNDRGTLLLNRGTELTKDYIGAFSDRGYRSIYIAEDPADSNVVPDEDLSQQTRARAVEVLSQSLQTAFQLVSGLRSLSLEKQLRELESPQFQAAFARTKAFRDLENVVSTILDDVLSREALSGLVSLKTHSDRIYQHSIDVTVLAIGIGSVIGLRPDYLRSLALGCLLHDIGVIFIDEEIVNNSDGLSLDDWEVYKTHTVLGFNLLRNDREILFPHVAYEHHERQDGSGYPRGIRGSNTVKRDRTQPGPVPSVVGEIAAVADLFDILSSDTLVRPAYPPEEAATIMRRAGGGSLNSGVLKGFFSVVPPFPVGTEVQLSGGRFDGFSGIVVEVRKGALDKPTILLTRDSKGKKIEPDELDLRWEEEEATLVSLGA